MKKRIIIANILCITMLLSCVVAGTTVPVDGQMYNANDATESAIINEVSLKTNTIEDAIYTISNHQQPRFVCIYNLQAYYAHTYYADSLPQLAHIQGNREIMEIPHRIPISKFGFSRTVPISEMILRQKIVSTACSWLGANQEHLSHKEIIDIYNTLDPLPNGYTMTYSNAWCAAFVSTVAIQCNVTDIIPPEYNCSRQIACFQNIGHWEENDNYLPLPGDLIYYDWDNQIASDCVGTADHVGIVVGTYGPWILVMEGNKNGCAEYRRIPRNHQAIRGFGVPNYAEKARETVFPKDNCNCYEYDQLKCKCSITIHLISDSEI